LDLPDVLVFADEDWALTGAPKDSKRAPTTNNNKVERNRRQFTTTSILALKVGSQ
jgi:hypothetical protein